MVKIIEGDVFDKKKVEDAIKGQDAVLSALGAGKNYGETTIMSDGCRVIISGMKKHNIKKLIVVSAGYLLPGGGKSPPIVAKLTEDHARQVEVLKTESESIDWIAVMSPKIKDSTNINPNYKVEKGVMPGITEITTAELADFMVKTLKDKKRYNDFTHSKPGISSTEKNVV